MSERTQSLVQPAIRDDRHYAYETVYREQLRAIDLKPCLHYRIHPADGTPVAPALIHLGRQFSLMGDDGWNLAATDDRKRALIQDAILLHRTKGTPGGVEAALARAGLPSSRIHERLGSAALPASRHDGRFRHDADILHDSGVVTPDRGWAIFGVSFDAGELAQARSRFADIEALIDTYKRACCHLAWLKPETRLIDPVPKPWDGQSIEAKTSLRDRLLKGPFHNGLHRRGACQRPLHDGAYARKAALRYGGLPAVTKRAEIFYRRPILTEALSITVQRPFQNRLKARSTHNGLFSYRGVIRHNAARAAPEERLTVTGGDFTTPAKDRIFGRTF